MTETLEPTLTRLDERILAALDANEARDLWDIGRRIGHLDLAELARILGGLSRLRRAIAVGGIGWDPGKTLWRRPLTPSSEKRPQQDAPKTPPQARPDQRPNGETPDAH